METQDPSKDDIIRAKQAISPAGLGDQSTEGNSGPGAEPEAPELEADAAAETYMDGDEPAADLPLTHPNRNRDGKADVDKPGYGGGH